MASGLANPIGKGLTPERVDQGVDYGGSGPLYALGDGTIVNLHNAGWPNNTFLVLKLNQPVGGQQYVYYAEDLTPLVKVGQKVKAGQHIANATGGGSGIEIGWASSNLGQAAAHAQFTGSNSTTLGAEFSNLIKSLGGPPGILQNTVQGVQGNVPGVSAAGATPSGAVGNTSGSAGAPTITGTGPDPNAPGGIIGFAERLPVIGGLVKALEPLLHAVATVIDYSFTMFEPGQGQRALFGIGALVMAFLSYRVLTSSGTVPHLPKVAP